MSSTDKSEQVSETSIGELIGNISNDLSQLFRQEVELAKAEVKEEAAKAGKAAGMLGGAGFAGYLTVLMLSFAAVYGLANVMDAGWAALIVAVIWAIVAGVLALQGRNKVQEATPPAPQTVETLKEDVEWAKTRRPSGAR